MLKKKNVLSSFPENVLFCPSKRKPLGLNSTPTQSQMTALLPSPAHHVCMDEMGHYIIAEKASTNWQTTAFAGLLSDLILTMTKPHNHFGPRGSQWQGGVPKDEGRWEETGVEASDNHPPTHTDIARHMNMDGHYINVI